MIVRASVTVEWTKKSFLLSGQKACLPVTSNFHIQFGKSIPQLLMEKHNCPFERRKQTQCILNSAEDLQYLFGF